MACLSWKRGQSESGRGPSTQAKCLAFSHLLQSLFPKRARSPPSSCHPTTSTPMSPRALLVRALIVVCVIVSLTGCSAYAVHFMQRNLPSESDPQYILYAAVARTQGPETVHFVASVSDVKSRKVLIVEKRKVRAFDLTLDGGMRQGRFWVTAKDDNYHPETGVLEFARDSTGHFYLVRQEGILRK